MRRGTSWTTVAAVVVLGLLSVPVAASLESESPEGAGLSAERLKRVHEAMQRHIDAGAISGGVTALARHGKLVHLEAHGLMDLESKKPMTTEALFKIMSMTKPVVGVAIMTLVEEGTVRLSDPVSRFIPELADLQVAVALPQGRGRGAGAGGGGAAAPGGRGQAPPFYTVPASRPITIQDLLTHTSGLASGTISNAESGRLAPLGPTDTLADVIPKLGQVPLEFQPGDRWAYSAARGFDTLLRVVEIVSGKPADQFLRERIFEPLGMRDTSFYAEGDPRMVTLYQATPEGLRKSPNQAGVTSRTYFSGGGGLVSTARDYMRFGQMLLDGGELDGVRVLGPRTVGLMSSTVLPDERFGGPGVSFGLSMQVVNDPVAAGLRVGEGSFGWDGAFGTHVWIDPENDLVGLVLLQTSDRQVFRDVENAFMQAIVD